MPKRPSNAYDEDDGFVAGSGEEDRGPKSKRVKVERGKKERGKRAVKKEGGEGGEVGGGGMRDGKGDEFWEIAEKRRLTISTYNKTLMVNIREYYDKDGEMLPGKKGISLSLPQFATVVSLLPHIEAALKAKGESIPRPEYSKSGARAGDDKGKDEEDEEGAVGEGEGGEESEEEEGRRTKKNFEATSDEDG